MADILTSMSSIDLISLKIQIVGGKVLFKTLEFESQSGRVKFFAIFLFFFAFFIFSLKKWILKHKLPFLYINWLHRNEIKFVQYTYFYWYLSGKRRYKRTFYVSIFSFLWRIWKWKEKGTKKVDLPWRGFEPRIFEQIRAHDLNFEGD